MVERRRFTEVKYETNIFQFVYPPDDHTCNVAMGINKLVGRVVLVDLLFLGGVGL